MRPSFIGHYTDFLDDDNASYPGSSELLSIGAAVGRKLGLQKIGIHIELLPPGRRTSWPHAESLEEEFAFVIEGTPDAWIDGNLHPLKEGDFVAFPAGTGIAHTFINNTDAVVRLLVGGESNKSENKIFYPLHSERNKELKERYWTNHPAHEMGSHDGLPDRLRSGTPLSIPTLETERLILRPFESSDAPDVFKYASRPDVTQWFPWETHQKILDSEKYIKMIQKNYVFGRPHFAICLKSKPTEVIGDVCAFWRSRNDKTMEVGAILSEEHWGKGYMAEGLHALIDYLWKTQPVVRIQSRCMKENRQSFRMLQKVGMTYEGTLSKSFMCKGVLYDMEMFSLIKV